MTFLLTALIHAADAAVWTRWECRWRAGSEPEAAAVFTAGTGERLESPAFRDGEEWVARIAFPAPGAWLWRSTDSKAKGAVTVQPYQGSNALYRHGFLKVSSNRRFLEHADGTPFFWMGDTAWYSTVKASEAEWGEYLLDRASKGFSAVQISAVGDREEAVTGFDADGNMRPEYWRTVEQKIEQANQAGLAVLVVGLGRPRDAGQEALVATGSFAREVAARLQGNHVIFSPNFDSVYRPVFDKVAQNLRPFLPRHLITQHPGTKKGLNEEYNDRSYLDFHALQSGHHNGKLNAAYAAAREWTTNLRVLTPVRPVLNVETMYDGRGNDEGANWRGSDVRKLGWISWLAGAMGYTYGAGETARKVPDSKGGIWGWNQNKESWDYWRKALAWPSSSHMATLRQHLSSIRWWDLEPAPDLLIEPGADPQTQPLAARIGKGGAILAYTPAGRPIRLRLPEGFSAQVTWWRTTRPERIGPAIAHSGTELLLTPPEQDQDWAVLVERRK